MKLRFAALMTIAAVMAGCGEDPAKAPEYAGLVGKVYETKMALLVKTEGFRQISLDVPGEGAAPSLAEIPSLMKEGTIPVLLPPGSRFEVVDVYSHWSTTSGGQIRFTLRMLTPVEYQGFELSYIGIIDYNRHPRRFRADLMEEAAK